MKIIKKSGTVFFIIISSLCQTACSTSNSEKSEQPEKEYMTEVAHPKGNTT
ncbi:hypothetical protein [Bacillus sp. FJAT-49736]|uniref:hypothetical protein n=1 Tax=Bacillus sp. FJAT-49736 TaxID=2833582 RepID=UPI001BC99A18|nr:hypothetical protein [Bacillus sp. FJAT-49736]MBS4174926.1 hypothetical protein [Bacillus sp. FJAT-49736]